jgi:hypothetical protein
LLSLYYTWDDIMEWGSKFCFSPFLSSPRWSITAEINMTKNWLPITFGIERPQYSTHVIIISLVRSLSIQSNISLVSNVAITFDGRTWFPTEGQGDGSRVWETTDDCEENARKEHREWV